MNLTRSHLPVRMRLNRNLSQITNNFNVPLIPNELHEKLFGLPMKKCVDKKLITKAKKHLNSNGIDPGKLKKSPTNNVSLPSDFKLPEIHSNDIAKHFNKIAQDQIKPYRTQILKLMTLRNAPRKPRQWSQNSGWTKYKKDGSSQSVPFPDEDILVFDIEVCVSEARWPAMATAMSPTHWYSWTSKHLFDSSERPPKAQVLSQKDLIPLGEPLIVIGHNVGFDRSFIAEQYNLKSSSTRFLDTMSLHIAISGVTSDQRAQLMKMKSLFKKNNDFESEDITKQKWMNETSMNSLKDLHKFYFKDAQELDKDTRNVFVKGTLQDVMDDFDNLIDYCCNDVVATFKVFQKVYKKFEKNCPHPVTLAGMLEMSVSYLPTNSSWFHYTKECANVSEELEKEIDVMTARQAQEACQLLYDEKYRNDLWLWNLDWKCTELKIKKTKSKKIPLEANESDTEMERLEKKFWPLLKHKEDMLRAQSNCPGYPKWYGELCQKYDPVIGPTPVNLGHGREVVPRLLRLTWNGYPLHKDKELKWGYIVPESENLIWKDLEELVGHFSGDDIIFPYKDFLLKTQSLQEAQTACDTTDRSVKNLGIFYVISFLEFLFKFGIFRNP